ncbi:MAG: MFS transporter [Lachnospiraceae bacterium]|nr:MFS transporter [Lachnospiraceae bacterium]
MERQKPEKRRLRAVVFAFLVQLFQNIAFGAINSQIAGYGSYLGMSAMLAGILTGMTFVSSLLTRPVVGPLQMRFDRTKILAAVFAAGIVLQSGYLLVRDPRAVAVIRFFGGMQGAAFSSIAFTIAAENLPADHLVQGLGFFGIAPAIGGAVGPAAAAWLFSRTAQTAGRGAGYRNVFLLAVVFLALGLIAALLIGPQHPARREGEAPRKWYRNISDRRAFWPAVIILLIFMPYTLLNSYMVSYAESLGLHGISYFFLVFAAGIIGSRPLANRLSVVWGVRAAVLTGLGMFALALAGLSVSRSLASLLVFAVLAAAGFGMTQPGCQTLAIQSVHPAEKPLGVTAHFIGIDIGCIFGPVLFGGAVYTLTGDFGRAFLLAAVPLVLAAAVLLLYWPVFCKRREEYLRLAAEQKKES